MSYRPVEITEVLMMLRKVCTNWLGLPSLLSAMALTELFLPPATLWAYILLPIIELPIG